MVPLQQHGIDLKTVNVKLLSFDGKYAMIERPHSLYISSARTWQYLFHSLFSFLFLSFEVVI